MSIKARLAAAGVTGVLAVAGSIAYLFEGEVREPYLDPVGIQTVCIGHVGRDILDKVYSSQECTEVLVQDLRVAHAAVTRCTPGLPDDMQAALTSFVFNVGQGAYCKSTLARKANQGDLVGACNELPRWVYAKGKKLPGLVTRREAERSVCLRGAYAKYSP